MGLLLALSLFFVEPPPPGDVPVAYTSVRVESPGDPVRDGVSLLVEDGVVTILDGAPPQGVREVDASGWVAVPAFVDPFVLSLTAAPTSEEPEEQEGPLDEGRSFALDPSYRNGLSPEISAADFLALTDESMKELRAAGFGAALAAPPFSGWRGRSAVLDLWVGASRDVVLANDMTQHLSLRPPRSGGYPSTLMGVLAHVRQFLADAERNQRLWARYDRRGGTVRRPQHDPQYDAVRSVLAGVAPVFVEADTTVEIRAALDLAREFGLRLVVVGGREAYRMASELHDAGASVILAIAAESTGRRGRGRRADSDGTEQHDHDGHDACLEDAFESGRWLEPEPELAVVPSRVVDDPADGGASNAKSGDATGDEAKTRLERAADERINERMKGIATLIDRSVPVSFTSNGAKSAATYRAAVAKAIEHGVSREDALAAMTSSAAHQIGMGDVLGRLRSGAQANIAFFEGDPLDPKSPLRALVIRGRDWEVPEEKSGGKKSGKGGRSLEAKPAPEAAGRPAAPRSLTGTWDVDVSLDGGDRSYVLSLIQEEDRLSGAAEAQSGPGQISGGSVDGKTVSFTVAYAFGDRNYEFVYAGQVEEARADRMSGTVSINGGTAYPFSGQKKKDPEGAR